MPLFPLFHPTKKQQTQHLERAMTGPTPGAAPVSHSYPPRHHQRHQRRPRAAAAGPASLLALLACCSTALGFVVPPRAPMSRIHVLPGGGPHGASSSSSSTATMMMTAADELPQDQNLPTLPSSSSPPRSTLPAVLGGLSLPFLARTGQAALAAPGAGRIAGRATDIPPPPPPSNSRIERSYTPSRSSSSSFEFSRSIPKVCEKRVIVDLFFLCEIKTPYFSLPACMPFRQSTSSILPPLHPHSPLFPSLPSSSYKNRSASKTAT